MTADVADAVGQSGTDSSVWGEDDGRLLEHSDFCDIPADIDHTVIAGET